MRLAWLGWTFIGVGIVGAIFGVTLLFDGQMDPPSTDGAMFVGQSLLLPATLLIGFGSMILSRDACRNDG